MNQTNAYVIRIGDVPCEADRVLACVVLDEDELSLAREQRYVA